MRILVAGVAPRVEPFLAQLFTGLSRRGHRVTLVAERPIEAGSVDPTVSWMPWPAGRAPSGRVRARRLLHWSPASHLAWRQLADRFDVVYVPWPSVLVADPWLGDAGLPVVVSCRGSQITVRPWDPSRPGWSRQLGEVFALAAAVHCVSAGMVDEAEEHGLDRSKAVVIRPAVDLDRFGQQAAGGGEGPFRVVSTGSLIWRKGLEYALAAIAEVVAAGVDVTYEIVGDGPERERVVYTAHDLGIADRVRLLGRLPPVQVPSVLRRADAFVLSSHTEGISNAVLEAMAAGVAVVTTDGGGMSEAVGDGEEGFVVPVREPRAMARALLELASSPDRARLMGAAGRARVVRDFDLRDHVTAFEGLLGGVTR